jgi:hypothetical protein
MRTLAAALLAAVAAWAQPLAAQPPKLTAGLCLGRQFPLATASGLIEAGIRRIPE